MKRLLKFLCVLVLTMTTALPVRADETTAIQSVTVVGATQQSGTPTPNTPMDIVSNNGVLKASKNLYNPNSTWNINASESYTEDPQKLVLPFSTGGNRYTYFMKVKPNTTYTLSAKTAGDRLYIGALTSVVDPTSYTTDNKLTFDSVIVSLQSNIPTSYTFTTGANDKMVGIYYSLNTLPVDFMIEQGSAATAYHPYGEVYVEGTTETITDSANHTATVATLLGIGDNYKDEQNINTGAITRRVGVKVLDGTEDWVAATSQQYLGNWYCNNLLPDAVIRTAGFCTHFEMIGALEYGKCVITTNGRLNCWYGSTGGDFKQFLAEQYAAGTPVIIVYPLATPTTESVTAQTITTAPVRQVGGSLRTTIRTVLTSGQELVSGSISSGIQIATTKYTEDAFAGLMTTLSEAITKVTNIVDTTVQQATEIGNLATTKQDRPETDCPAGRKCLLIMGADNKPHWYLIQE